MKVVLCLLVAGLSFAPASCGGRNAVTPGPNRPPPGQQPWTVTWSDEFGRPNGLGPARLKRAYDLRGKGAGYSGDKGLTGTYTLASAKFSDDFHVVAVEWEPNVVRFYVDGSWYETRTPSDIPASARWVYDHPFFMVLNVAVGGNWPGNPDSTTTFPQKMLVDYVRVYSRL